TSMTTTRITLPPLNCRSPIWIWLSSLPLFKRILDLLVFFLAALWFVWAYMKLGVGISGEERREGSMWLLAMVLISPCLVLIDHGHFQYNCISLGLTLGAIAGVLSRNELIAAALFTLAINHKQVHTILDKENFTLKELLDEDEIIQDIFNLLMELTLRIKIIVNNMLICINFYALIVPAKSVLSAKSCTFFFGPKCKEKNHETSKKSIINLYISNHHEAQKIIDYLHLQHILKINFLIPDTKNKSVLLDRNLSTTMLTKIECKMEMISIQLVTFKKKLQNTMLN
ncbi:hypothetical protein ACJX0J_038402, partial [Zea mays]